jgi:hypothetical protein
MSKLEALHPDIVQQYLKSGYTGAIPPQVQVYIDRLDKVPELLRRYPSISRCARELLNLYPDGGISFQTARQLIYDAINYFHLNNTVRNEAWDHYYADRFEEIARIAMADNNTSEARRLMEKAHELRTRKDESQIDPDKLRPMIQVISPQVTPGMLGLKEKNLKTIWSAKKQLYDDSMAFVDGLKDVPDSKRDSIRTEIRQNLNMDDGEVIDDSE